MDEGVLADRLRWLHLLRSTTCGGAWLRSSRARAVHRSSPTLPLLGEVHAS